MRIARILVLIGIMGFLAQRWMSQQDQAPTDPGPSPNGFISAVMPDGARSNTVVILAPLNCPSAAAQRADALAQQLSRAGVPNVRSSSFSTSIPNPSAEQREGIERAVTVLKGEIPAVFVNGMASANPSFDEVLAEYERTR
jgi:hypothetical protein